jgi:hypothetical protein
MSQNSQRLSLRMPFQLIAKPLAWISPWRFRRFRPVVATATKVEGVPVKHRLDFTRQSVAIDDRTMPTLHYGDAGSGHRTVMPLNATLIGRSCLSML